MSGVAELPRLAVVIFSKDRPYQLLSCLGSLLRRVRGVALDVSVLFRASAPSYAESYEVLRRLFAAPQGNGAAAASFTLTWEEEADEAAGQRGLGDLLDRALDRAEASCAEALLFTVDDAFWFGDFDASAALSLLRANGDVYAVHAKLCPRVEYAHPNNRFMRLPPFSCATNARAPGLEPGKAASAASGLLVFERAQGEYDWNYPWELSASMYRTPDVREMLALIREHFGREGVDHPNRLEGYGVRLIKQEKVPSAARSIRCACMEVPVVAVVTINRVQCLFDNPTYGRGGGQAPASEESPEALDKQLRAELWRSAKAAALDGMRESVQEKAAVAISDAMASAGAQAMAERTGLSPQWLSRYWASAEDEFSKGVVVAGDALMACPPRPLLAEDLYRSAYLDSVHIPLLDVLDPPPAWVPCQPNPLVSWLVPVRNAPTDWLEAAWHSIAHQEGMGPGSWELVVVDDNSDADETLQVLSEWETLPHVRVLRLRERQGVAGALNSGWAICNGEFVARLDADDIAASDRLRKQLSYFAAHPSLGALGGGFRTFRKVAELSSAEGLAQTRLYRMPCHPVLARWRMLFGCSLAHPTVTMRREAFDAGRGGPYPEGQEAEDHCCWLGVPDAVQYANLADCVGFLRRHSASRSASAAEAIRHSSYEAVRRFIAERCGHESGQPRAPCEGGAGASPVSAALSDADMAVLWGAGASSSAAQSQRVSRALNLLEEHFLRFISTLEGDALGLPPGFADDFIGDRREALADYIKSSCSKLRGMIAVQSLAAGDLSSGTEMVKLWLNGGDAGLKSLGALIGAGFAAQDSSTGSS